MACNHNSRGWRAPADTRDDGTGGWRCVDCGLVLCAEFIHGDLRSPNGKRSLARPEFCDRVATLAADWTTVDGISHTSHVCGIHRRRLVWAKNLRPFDNVPVGRPLHTRIADAQVRRPSVESPRLYATVCGQWVPNADLVESWPLGGERCADCAENGATPVAEARGVAVGRG